MQFFKYRVVLLPLLFSLCLNLSAQDALQQSSDFLQQYAGKFGVTADVQWRVVDNFTDLSSIDHVRLLQTYEDIDIENQMVTLHLKEGGRIVTHKKLKSSSTFLVLDDFKSSSRNILHLLSNVIHFKDALPIFFE